MALFNKIEKYIQNTVGDFCKQIAEKYDISKEELMEMWKETSKSKKKNNGKTRKISGYQNFQKQVRELIKKENPKMSFGEVSREIGLRWKALSPSEKSKYEPLTLTSEDATTSLVTKEEKVPVMETSVEEMDESPSLLTASVMEETEAVTSPAPTPAEKTPKKKKTTKAKKTKKASPKEVEEDSEDPATLFNQLGLKDLKKVCKEKGLSTKGLTKKQELVDLLVDAHTSSKPKAAEEGKEEGPLNNDEDDDASSTHSDLLEEVDDETLLE